MEEQDSNIENIQEAIIQNDEKQIKQKKIKLIALVVSIITVISVVATILLNNLINASDDSLMYVPTRVKITFEDGSISYTSIKYNSKGFIEKIDYQDDSVKFEYDKNGNITKAIYDSILIGGDSPVFIVLIRMALYMLINSNKRFQYTFTFFVITITCNLFAFPVGKFLF